MHTAKHLALDFELLNCVCVINEWMAVAGVDMLLGGVVVMIKDSWRGSVLIFCATSISGALMRKINQLGST